MGEPVAGDHSSAFGKPETNPNEETLVPIKKSGVVNKKEDETAWIPPAEALANSNETLTRPSSSGDARKISGAKALSAGSSTIGLGAEPAKSVALVPGYENLGELGRGGMGVVYKARQLSLNRVVALKMVLSGPHAGPQERARFRTEAEAVASLHHPNIVQIHDVGEYQGQQYFSLEFVDGSSLDETLASTPQPTRATAQLVETLAEAIHAAHQQGIVHRDLKPGNVLLVAPSSKDRAHDDASANSMEHLYGVPKISDFGLAKRLDVGSGQTQSGELLGTPSYMAPEQAAGKTKEIGPAADVYALGAILYEMLTGRPPFKAVSPMDTLWQVIYEEPVPPARLRPKLPKDLERICLKCLEKDPRKRYASARDLADDLRRHLKGEPVHARPVGGTERLWRWCRRNPLPASILAAVTLGSAFGLWHLSRLSRFLVQSTALTSAAQQSETFNEVNAYYSLLVNHLMPDGIHGSHDWKTSKATVPIPATFTIELGQRITQRSETGVQVRLYSDYPFRFRKDGGPKDDFEREALSRLRADPDQAIYRFEDFQGRASLRYATARRMVNSCIPCHNSHPDNPKHDWKEGDVRGILEIIRPLDKDIARVQEGLRGTFILVGTVGASMLGLSGLVLFISNRRRRKQGFSEPKTL